MNCPNCSEIAPDGAAWCEACGADLSPGGGRTCISCGEQEVSDDDYCMACGHKQPSERDHQTFTDGLISAVSDRGKRHHHNEDAVAIGSVEQGGAVAVVCDGVSSTPGSAEASLGAAIAARNSLVIGINRGETSAPQVATLLATAAAEAQSHAAKTPRGKRRTKQDTAGPPSATFVACVALPTTDSVDVFVGWLGDSRAYWLDGNNSSLLTSDHAVEGSLSRWIGADAPNPTPEVIHHNGSLTGRLIVCSDGLWRYAETASEMDALVARLEADTDAGSDITESLVEFANESGGHDNISVALWPTSNLKNFKLDESDLEKVEKPANE